MNPGTSARLLSISALLALGVGCTYVTQADLEEHFDLLDEDNDGVTKGEKDCDDNDATRSQLLEEIPYDGIDNNCDGSDLVDVDGDSYPGLLKSEWTPLNDGVEWPTGVRADVVDCADDPNIIAEAQNIFPDKVSDLPYDGLDSDCAGDNDYDVDVDGDMPPGYESDYAAYTELWGITATGTFTDCDDFDHTTYGGAPDDVWYDGTDTDCAGNNDFDQDADGYMPDESTYGSDYNNFLNAFHDGVAPASFGSADWGDCRDEDSTANPGASDTWYDGADSDCDGQNDFDQDADGWIRAADSASYDIFVAEWGYTGDTQVGDCIDTDATINPDMLESIDDGIDTDCDGDENTAPFGYADLLWTAPRPPAIAGTTGHFILVSAADNFEGNGIPNTNAGVALAFERTAGADADYFDRAIIWQGQTSEDPIGEAVDVVASGDKFWASTVYTRTSTDQTFLIAKSYNYRTADSEYVNGATDVRTANSSYTATNVDLPLDNADNAWAWATGGDRVHVLHGDGTSGLYDGAEQSFIGAENIFINSANNSTSTATACDSAGCQTLAADGGAITATVDQDWSTDSFTHTSSHDGIWVLAPSTGLLIVDGSQTHRVLSSFPILHADAILYDGLLYIAAVIDDGASQVMMLHGDPNAGTFAQTIFPINADRTLTPTGVAIHADADRIMLAISAEDGTGDDAVGWAFLGH
ncbi:MAG: hypothetical protein GWP91_07470 [Rhodobacterales bacterium]|nr:hypothetical protein [Rhodobacterales bacterium]